MTIGTANSPRAYSGNSYVGLFGQLGEHAVVKDLALDGIDLHLQGSDGWLYTGGVAGQSMSSTNTTGAIVNNVHVDGDIVANVKGDSFWGENWTGGIFAYQNGGSIANCSADVNQTTTSEVGTGGIEAAGISAHQVYGAIVNCSAAGDISIDNHTADPTQTSAGTVAGIVGASRVGIVSNCYSMTNLTNAQTPRASAGPQNPNAPVTTPSTPTLNMLGGRTCTYNLYSTDAVTRAGGVEVAKKETDGNGTFTNSTYPSVASMLNGNLESISADSDLKANIEKYGVKVSELNKWAYDEDTNRVYEGLVDLGGCTMTGLADKTYTGKRVEQGKIAVKNGNEDASFTLAYDDDATSVGAHSVTATGTGMYVGTLKGTYRIAKRANTIHVSPMSKTIKHANVVKKAQKVTVRVTKAKGPVTYKVTKKASGKISVTKKGIVTIKKGAKKGKYVIAVTAAGNGTYKAGSKKVTIKVR